MKFKKLICILLAVTMVMSLFACGSNSSTSSDSETTESEESTDSTYTSIPEITDSSVKIGEYIGVQYIPEDISVDDETLQEELDYYVSSLTELVESDKESVENGDYVNVDYCVYVDDMENASITELEIDIEPLSGYIDTEFEIEFIGASVGDELELTVTYDEDSDHTYAGHTVKYTATINSILEYKEYGYDDEMAAEYGFDSYDEFVEAVTSSLEEANLTTAISNMETNVVDTLIDTSTFDISDEDLLNYSTYQVNLYSEYADYYGVDYETFINDYIGMTTDEFTEYIAENCLYLIQLELVLTAVFDAEHMDINDYYDDFAYVYAVNYGYEDVESFSAYYSASSIERQVKADMALRFVLENTVAVDESGKEIEDTNIEKYMTYLENYGYTDVLYSEF